MAFSSSPFNPFAQRRNAYKNTGNDDNDDRDFEGGYDTFNSLRIKKGSKGDFDNGNANPFLYGGNMPVPGGGHAVARSTPEGSPGKSYITGLPSGKAHDARMAEIQKEKAKQERHDQMIKNLLDIASGNGPLPSMTPILNSISSSYKGQMSQLKGLEDRGLGVLAKILGNNLEALNGIRAKTNEQYDNSNTNLKNMFGAMAEVMATKGKAAYKDITADQLRNLARTTDAAVDRIQDVKQTQQNNRREAFKNLGIAKAMEGNQNPDVLNQTIGTISRSNNAREQSANEIGAANRSRNRARIQSTKLAGAEARSDLRQQLDAILGGLSQKESEFRNNYATNKMQLMNQYDQKRMSITAEANQARQSAMQTAYQLRDKQAQRAIDRLDQIHDEAMKKAESEAEKKEAELEYKRTLEKINLKAKNRMKLEKFKASLEAG